MEDNIKLKKLATYLHSQFCNANHIDQCSWDYDSDWEKDFSKRYWLRQAEDLVEYLDI